jgi:hypothetical protein
MAQGLFEQARVLMEQKRFAEACPKLAESQRLDPGGGTLLNLAVCHAGEGKIATALVEYNEALATAVRDGRKDREAIARSSIDALEHDVPRLTVTVPRPASGMEVKLDQSAVPQGAWGMPLPVDPGHHVLTASAPGSASTAVDFEIAVGERKSIEAHLAPVTQPTVEAPRPTSGGGRSHSNPVFVVALAGMAGASTIAVASGVVAAVSKVQSDSGCISERSWCRDADSRDAHERARAFAWVSTGALVAAAVGVVVLLVTPSRVREAAPATTARWYGLGATF